MFNEKKRSRVVWYFLLLAVPFSYLLSSLLIYLLANTTFFETALFSSNKERIAEFSSRLFLTWIFLFLGVAIIFCKNFRDRYFTERWQLFVFILFALGAGFAMSDPAHRIGSEGNWIRYWTAGVLAAAGGIAFLSGFSSNQRLFDRLFGGLFGPILIMAAADELFEFHEVLSRQFEDFTPLHSEISLGDMVTLGIAALGAAALAAAVLAARLIPWVRDLVQERRYRRTFLFFTFAVLCFSIGMLFDSFDWALEGLVDQLRFALLGGTSEVPYWIGANNMLYAANSLEELLEYLAAINFLMMIGTLFSVKAIGCVPSTVSE